MYIGILLRKQLIDNNIKYTLNEEIVKMLEKKGCIPIGIKNIESVKLCDGIILQGGTDFDDEDIKFVKYLYDNNVPTLGICLGMQMMAYMKNGQMEYTGDNTHLSNLVYAHNININNKSKLYEILGTDRILVNSRHIEKIVSTNLFISSYSDDNIIESIEDSNKLFFIGVQWHPESIIDKDIYSNLLIDSFLSSCNE